MLARTRSTSPRTDRRLRLYGACWPVAAQRHVPDRGWCWQGFKALQVLATRTLPWQPAAL